MKTLIVAGGDINSKMIAPYTDYNIIAVDRGLEVLYKLKIIPNHVVGDFDSVSSEVLKFYQDNPQVIFHPFCPEKDNTDTDIALQLALSLPSDKIIIMGALGGRMDHALANIHILNYALEAGVPCQIIDDYNRIYLINDTTIIHREQMYGKYISLFPLTTKVEGLTLRGFRYLLQEATLTMGKSLGVSNELIEKVGRIELKKGILIVIESRD